MTKYNVTVLNERGTMHLSVEPKVKPSEGVDPEEVAEPFRNLILEYSNRSNNMFTRRSFKKDTEKLLGRMLSKGLIDSP